MTGGEERIDRTGGRKAGPGNARREESAAGRAAEDTPVRMAEYTAGWTAEEVPPRMTASAAARPETSASGERLAQRLLAECGDGGATAEPCRSYLAGLDPLHRTEFCTSLLFERLERKMRTLEALRADAGGDWNETFYLLYFRTLADRENKAAYLDLAHRLPYRFLRRERLTPHAVEAMLLGTSGLLDRYRGDDYLFGLAREYDHFRAKYGLQPMAPEAWRLQELRPANHPVLRLAQAAEFFRQDELLMDRTMACRTEQDIRRLFCIEAAPYWQTHALSRAAADDRPKRIGRFKAHILGINLVAVLQFAYGSHLGKEALRDGALALLEKLPPEENRYMRGWQAAGLRPRDAFESQALLQLSTEHCARGGCRDCPVARRLLRRMRDLQPAEE